MQKPHTWWHSYLDHDGGGSTHIFATHEGLAKAITEREAAVRWCDDREGPYLVDEGHPWYNKLGCIETLVGYYDTAHLVLQEWDSEP